MTARGLWLLAALAVVSLAAAAVVLRGGPSTIASDRRGERVLPGLAAKVNDITGLTVRQHSDTLAVEHRDGGFVAAESGWPIKLDLVRDAVAGAIALVFEEARTADPARYTDLGLADPTASGGARELVLRAGNTELADIFVGIRDSGVGGAGGVYVRLKGQPQTWLARGDVKLPARKADWFVGVDLGAKRDDIRKLTLTGGGKDAVTASAAKPGELVLENVPEGRAADTGKLTRLTTLVESFNFEDVRKRTQAAAADARHLTVDVGETLRITVTPVGEPAEGWVQIAAEPIGDAKREQAQALSAKLDGYDFRLPPGTADVLGWTVTDLTNEQKS
jgi:Domain of unknown function (DUF4340)